ncbi:MAG TPA: cbb3-type cytochrome c oxidase subunit I [Acidimicrobiia bacterium]|nr:cbb3-type cytochrome c oxidase subunit I [Acidimicrobiia bacterium]
MSRPGSAATGHLLASAAFLASGGILWLLALASVRFPGLVPMVHGHLRAMALTGLLLGWLVLGLSGGIYYVLPRLTGSPLQAEGLALLALPTHIVVVSLGMVAVGLGFGDGREPFALPLILDVLVLGLLTVPALVTLATIRHRHEESLYPTMWFILAAVIWLPILYLAGNLPGLNSLAAALSDLVFSAGFLAVWGLGLATGLAYYAVPKTSDQPLANRQLAKVGFWSIIFGAVWAGPVQLVAGPLPEWSQGVAAVLGLALPIGAVANATNFSLTVGPGWRRLRQEPVLAAALAGSFLAVLATSLTAIAGFRSTAVVVALTAFWDGMLYLLVLGAIGLLFGAFAWHALPNLVGRSVDQGRASTVVRRTVVYVTITSLLLVSAGLAAGYSWAGGAFTGSFAPVGDGWSQAMGLSNLLYGLAVLFGLGALLSQLGLALSLYRALTSGRATVQEVLIESGGDDE